MRLSLIVNILLVVAVATTVIGVGLFTNLLAVPGGASAKSSMTACGETPSRNSAHASCSKKHTLMMRRRSKRSQPRRCCAMHSRSSAVSRSPAITSGYFRDEKATRETIDTAGWLHTGDVGVLDARGYLKITDRLKDLYITGGFNCYPAEIERMMAAHPAIAQVAVVGVADERMGEVGKAYVVLRPALTLDDKTLIAWCREQMANYKVPRSVEFVASLPTNPSGKVMKFQLRNAGKS